MGFVSRSGRCSILMVFKNGGLRALEVLGFVRPFFGVRVSRAVASGFVSVMVPLVRGPTSWAWQGAGRT